MRAIFLLSFLFLAACGRQQIDPEFQPYLEKIQADFEELGKELSLNSDIVFGKTDGDASGTCYKTPFDRPKISIDKAQWDKFNRHDRYWILIHEIGHCDFGLGHEYAKEDGNMWEIPSDVMYYSSHEVSKAAQYNAGRKEFYLNQFIEKTRYSLGMLKADHQHPHE